MRLARPGAALAAWLLIGGLGCEPKPESECDDEADNDVDGLFDCDDPDCLIYAVCVDLGDDDAVDDDDATDDDDAADDDDVGPDDDDSAPPGVTYSGGGVGASTDTYVGAGATARAVNAGLGTFHADCAAAFANARMCTDVEVLHSFPAPAPGAEALVVTTVTTFEGVRHYTGAGLRILTSTVSSTSDLNCNGSGLFTSASQYDRFSYLNAAGNPRSGSCDTATTYVAACCSD